MFVVVVVVASYMQVYHLNANLYAGAHCSKIWISC